MSDAGTGTHRLRRLKLKRVSLVDKPANAHAEVVLFKRDDGAEKGDLGSSARGDLEDSAFAAVWTDADGKKQRKLPIHDAAHVRNALARFNQTDMPAEVKSRARQKLEAAARKFGVGEDGEAKKMSKDGTEPDADDVTKGECPECGAKVGKGDVYCPKCGEKLPAGAAMKSTSIDLDKIEDKDTRQAVEKALADLDAATSLAEEEQAKRIAAEKKAAPPAKPSDEDVLKGLTPEARDLVLKAREEAKAARASADSALEAVKKAAEEKREGEFVAKAKGYGNLPLKAETFGPVLKRLSDGVATKEDLDELARVLKAANEIAKGLFVQKGSSGRGAGGGSGAWAEIEAKAKELRETVLKSGDKLSFPDAVDRVIRENPELYNRHVEESRHAAVGRVAEEE